MAASYRIFKDIGLIIVTVSGLANFDEVADMITHLQTDPDFLITYNVLWDSSKRKQRQKLCSRVINLAFLSPDITESIITGRQPADLTTERLIRKVDLPLDWDKQRQLLGFI
jgi:hypothetical protein